MSKDRFVKRIKVWAVMNDVGMSELAERCGLAPSSLSRMMSEDSMPTLNTLKILSEQTGISVSEMVQLLLDANPELSNSQQEFVDLMLSLTQEQREAVVTLLDVLTGLRKETKTPQP